MFGSELPASPGAPPCGGRGHCNIYPSPFNIKDPRLHCEERHTTLEIARLRFIILNLEYEICIYVFLWSMFCFGILEEFWSQPPFNSCLNTSGDGPRFLQKVCGLTDSVLHPSSFSIKVSVTLNLNL